jgi:hypothetical protein
MLTEQNLLQTFRNRTPPINYGVSLDFLPSDNLLRDLCSEFKIEFGVVFEIDKNGFYNLYVGTRNSIQIPIVYSNKINILLKHTHPSGSSMPSKGDIIWLKDAQKAGSPQKQSMIIPHGNHRKNFNINTPPHP